MTRRSGGQRKAMLRRSTTRLDMDVAPFRNVMTTEGVAWRLLQEEIEDPLRRDHKRLVGLVHTVIAEHVRQHRGIEDAAGRRDEGAEILLPIKSVSEADALGSEMLSRNTRALIGSDLHALPVFVRGPHCRWRLRESNGPRQQNGAEP